MYKSIIDTLSIVSQKNGILERLLERFSQLELKPIIGVEIEFFLLNDIDINDLSNKTGFKIKEEKGNLQYEIDLSPSEDIQKTIQDIKDAMQTLSQASDFQISFAPKPYENEYGNSMHFHVNFLDRNNNNYFDQEYILNKSAAFLCEYALQTLLVFANTKQDLLRLDHRYMAPTHICFGGNNRTVFARIPHQYPKRIEHRLANPLNCPYLSIFIILKSIYLGIISNEAAAANALKRFPKIHGNAFDPQYTCHAIPNDLKTISHNFDLNFFRTNFLQSISII